MALSFEDVPAEIALTVFRNVKLFDLARCTQVSRNLYNMAMDPTLWNRASLLPSEVHALPTIIARSRNLPLELELWLENRTSPHQIKSYNALLDNMFRVRSLFIHGARSAGLNHAAGSDRTNVLQLLLRTPAPNLERFTLNGHRSSVIEVPATLLDGVAPRLKFVAFDNCYIDIDAVDVLQHHSSKDIENPRDEGLILKLGKGCVLTRKEFERREWIERFGFGGQLDFGFVVDPSYACAMMIASDGTALHSPTY